MNEDDRAILNYLNRADEDPNLDRWVLFITTDHQDFLMAESKQGANPEELDCDRADVASLTDRGYVDRQGNRFRISAKGKQLIARGYQEAPEEPQARSVQNINISGGNFGNFATTVEGDVTISNSPVQQNAAELQSLLQQLSDMIEHSDMPQSEKNDASIDLSQLRVELDRPDLKPGRVNRLLGSLRAVFAGASLTLDPLDKIASIVQSLSPPAS